MNSALDTNVIADILFNTQYANEAINCLEHYKSIGCLLINEIVYSEIACIFQKTEDLERFLKENDIIFKNTSQKGLIKASKEWKQYLKRRKIICSHCGQKIITQCNKCSNEIKIKQHLMPDFIIGAFAFCDCDHIITRDTGYYKTYFKGLKIKNYTL